MKLTKNILSIVMAVTIMLTGSTIAFGANNNDTTNISKTSLGRNAESLTSEQKMQQAREIKEKGGASFINVPDLKLGESATFVNEKGQSIIIVCTDEKDATATKTLYRTKYKSYSLYSRETSNKLCAVDLEVRYDDNGVNGSIESLTGTYRDLAVATSASWDRSQNYTAPWNHSMMLDVNSMGSSWAFYFGVQYNPYYSDFSIRPQAEITWTSR